MDKILNYKLSPSWRIEQQGYQLLLFGGGDARYSIELESADDSFFSRLDTTSNFTRTSLSESDKKILEQLITAEVVLPIVQRSNRLTVAMIGDKLSFELSFGDDVKPVDNQMECDLVLVTRYRSTHIKLLKSIDYKSIQKPHLYVDMGYHHTLSVGPLVFPGETSCLACLQGRLYERWGEDTPVEVPAVVADYSQLLSAIISSELDRINREETGLVGKTVVWNLAERSISTQQLLKVSICPICSVSAMKTGKILLE